jgi:hypothetical protein
MALLLLILGTILASPVAAIPELVGGSLAAAPEPVHAVRHTERLYPLATGLEWLFEETQDASVDHEVLRCAGKGVKADERGWWVLRGLRQGLRYLVRWDGDAVRLRKTRRPIPLLGKISVTFDPPIPLIRFPLKPGDRWTYEGEAQTWIKDRRIRIEFTAVGWEEWDSPAWNGRAWRVDCVVSHGKGEPISQTSYYAPGIGYIGGRTSSARTRILEFRRPSAGRPTDPDATETVGAHSAQVQDQPEADRNPVSLDGEPSGWLVPASAVGHPGVNSVHDVPP